ncbi:MAG: hypothetical protein H6Q26_1430 [Bacteroidetes bacterium]|nr:hypothetical protein [Bacteroidota bacterium]
MAPSGIRIKTFMKEGIHQRGMKTIFRKKRVYLKLDTPPFC